MQIEISYGDLETSAALTEHVENAVNKAMAHVNDRVTRVEVHLRDDKQKRRGPDDHRCMMEARIAGEQPLAVEAKGEDIYKVVTEAAGKVERAVTRRLEKHDEA